MDPIQVRSDGAESDCFLGWARRKDCYAFVRWESVMSVRETEKTSGNRRLKENRQLQSQMIVHGVKGTFGDAVGVQWMVGAR